MKGGTGFVNKAKSGARAATAHHRQAAARARIERDRRAQAKPRPRPRVEIEGASEERTPETGSAPDDDP